MLGLRLRICISSRGSLASTVTAGEVAEARAPKLRQQLELQIRRGRNCQTTGGRIVRKHCKYRGTRRCCQPGAQHFDIKNKDASCTWEGLANTLKAQTSAQEGLLLKWCVVCEKLPVRHHAPPHPPPEATMLLKNGG